VPDPSYPIKTTSYVSPVWLREDLPRDVASDYWAGLHAEIARRLPTTIEYVQHHFSPTDHGFWPSSQGVGTEISSNWRVDGFPKVRFKSTAAAFTTPRYMRDVFLDERNVFQRVLGQPTTPGGCRWWTDGFDDTVGQRVALLLSRRRGVRGSTFRRFVHDRIGPALFEAGARDLRTYTFLPWSRFMHITPDVSHDNPPERRYHGAVVFGTGSRAEVDDLLGSAQIAAIIADQHTVLTAVHAYAVERSVAAKRIGDRVPR
jgi:hypothetical protein